MKKRKVDTKLKGSNNLYKNEFIDISKEGDEYFFEIGNLLTNDIAEAVSIMIRRIDGNSEIWNLEINGVEIEKITPEKSLYWLSGGNDEWQTLENYNKPWSDCYLEFQEEFGMLIVNIIKKSKTFGDIKNKFIKMLNLQTLYDFALSRNMIR